MSVRAPAAAARSSSFCSGRRSARRQGPRHAHHNAARAVASRDASPVDMALRRAALEVCSTTGRSLLPRALGGAEAWTAALPASLWTQTRGKKKSTRRVEVVLHQDIEGLGRDGEIVSVRPGRARNHLVPNRIAVYANADKLEDAARRRAVWEGEIAEDADAGDDAAREEARTAMDILTKSKLVVKRIASGETKQPRIPVTAELLASEIHRQRKLQLDQRALIMDGPLATFGDHAVPVWVDRTLVPEQRTLTVRVERKR